MPFRLYLLLSSFLLITGMAGAQITAGPDTSISCTDTITLQANVVWDAGSTISLSDDQYSGVINIGFPFTWYDSTYTQCIISSNNHISFDLGNANAYSSWTITTPVPSTTNPLNAALGPFQDINPGVGGIIRYATLGTAPNRVFVVEYCNIPMFSCTSLQFSSQILLKENGNVMETHIINKPLCTTWNSGYAIHGTQNAGGNLATVVSGRNATQWTAASEGFQFYPISTTAYGYAAIPYSPVIIGPAPGTVTWTSNGVQVGTGSTLTVSPSVSTTYVATVSGGCAGITFADTVQVNVPSSNNVIISATQPSGSVIHEQCGSSTLTFTRQGNITVQDTMVITLSGTATNGVDHPFIPDTIIFPAGVSTWQLTLNAYTDFISEGNELVQINALLLDPCAFTPETYSLILNDLPQVDVIASADTTICPGGQANLSATGSGGVFNHPLIYSWSNSYSGTSQAVQPPATTTYYVTVTDSCGIHFDTDSVSVTVKPPIYATAGADTSICTGDSIQLFGAGAPVYNWTPATGLSDPGVFNPVASPVSTTTYLLEVSDGVCSSTDSITVIVNNLPDILISPQDTTICLSGTASMQAAGASVYTWAPTNSLSQPAGSQVVAQPTVTTTYTVLGTDQNGCKNSKEVTITVMPPLFVQGYGDTSGCAASINATLSAFGTGGNGGPYTYTWSPDTFISTVTGQVINANPEFSIPYVVTLTDNCGTPPVSDTVMISVLPVPDVQFSMRDSFGCEPLETQLFNLTDDAVSLQWDLGNGERSYSENPVITFSAGNYDITLTVTNSHGCSATSEKNNIYVSPEAIAAYEVNPLHTTLLNPEVFFTDLSTPDINSWYWNIGDGIYFDTVPEFSYIFKEAGIYPTILKVRNAWGCEDEITFTVIIRDEFLLFVPGAFSPNGDGKNDIFSAAGEQISWFRMQIFNRWGQMIYQTEDPGRGWDGTFNGVTSPEGVYIYVIEAEGSFESSRVRKEGTVTLVR